MALMGCGLVRASLMSYRTPIKELLRKMGFAIYRIPRGAQEQRAGYTYTQIHPNATLAPWLADVDFMAAYEAVQKNTLVDIFRLYELWSLVAETSKVGGDIVEVGVWRGGSGCLMAHREQLLGGSNTIFLCDTFQGVVKAGNEDSGYRGGEHNDTDVSYVEGLESKLGLKNIKPLIGIFPDDTAAELTSRRVRLLHIDVDVYQSAKDAVEHLWDRMPGGATIVFDDYGFVGCDGVTRYVDELRKSSAVLYMHNVNGHAIVIRR